MNRTHSGGYRSYGEAIRKIGLGMYVTERGAQNGKGEGVFQACVIIDYEINRALYLKPLPTVVSGVDRKFPYMGRVASVPTRHIIMALLVARRYTMLCSWLRTYMDQPTDPQADKWGDKYDMRSDMRIWLTTCTQPPRRIFQC